MGTAKAIAWTVTESGCHVCTSHRLDEDGYPCMTVRGRRVKIARRLYPGPLAAGVVLRHTCDNRLCVNPAHLLPGTHTENIADRQERGRQAKGEANGRAKLTEDGVRLILASNAPGRKLAARLGVDPKVVRMVRQRKIWRHVQPRGLDPKGDAGV